MRTYLKKQNNKSDVGVAHMVDCLPSLHKALDSISSTTKPSKQTNTQKHYAISTERNFESNVCFLLVLLI
jgi:hypothetical protein